MPLREELLEYQQANYRKNRKRIRDSLVPDRKLNRYARDYAGYVQTFNRISNRQEFFRQIQESDIVYHGDYHTLRASQHSVLVVLKDICEHRKPVLCLEMLYGSDQKWIDRFMAGKMTQSAFLRQIDYNNKWRFKWSQWKPLLDFCKKKNIPVLGINSDQTGAANYLKARDEYSSIIIGKAAIRYPDHLIYVMDGDFHIAPCHLPSCVEKRLKVFDVVLKRTIIYQNVEDLYWQLAEQEKEDKDILRISEDSFCIMTTTPVNKLQSYINWLEYDADAYYPIRGAWEEIQSGTSVTIPDLVCTICDFIDVPCPEDALENLSVYYAEDLDFMRRIESDKRLRHMLPMVRKKIAASEGFLLEFMNDNAPGYIIYLPNSSLTMAAEEAAHFVHATLRGFPSRPAGAFDRFYIRVITECLGFYGSRLIVPKRQVNSLTSLKHFVRAHGSECRSAEAKRRLKTARFIIRHKALEKKHDTPSEFRKAFNKLYSSRSMLPRTVSTQLGYMLGKRLYSAVKGKRISIKALQKIYMDRFEEPNAAFQTYMEILRKLD